MEKITVEVTNHSDIKPQAGDMVQPTNYPDCFFFVSGRGDYYGNEKETCHTTNASIINGKFSVWNSYGDDEDFKILMRNGEPFEYPKKPDYTAEIDGVKYKLVKE